MNINAGTYEITTTRSAKVWPSGAVGVLENGEFIGEGRITDMADLEAFVTGFGARITSFFFNTRTCNRCDGEGKNTAWGLADNTCWTCGGTGHARTQAAIAAQEMYLTEMLVPLNTLAVGTAFKYQGEAARQTVQAYHAQSTVKVIPMDWDRKITVIKAVAKAHPKGVTLVHKV